MNARAGVLASSAVVVLLLSGLALQGSYAKDEEQKPPKPPSEAQANKPSKAERQARKAKAQQLTPPGPGPHLAFDVRPKDYKKTVRYVLEITDPSGKLTTHDLQKPALQKRSILVPLPPLEPGKYKLVVVAESPGKPTRSAPLDLEIPKKS